MSSFPLPFARRLSTFHEEPENQRVSGSSLFARTSLFPRFPCPCCWRTRNPLWSWLIPRARQPTSFEKNHRKFHDSSLTIAVFIINVVAVTSTSVRFSNEPTRLEFSRTRFRIYETYSKRRMFIYRGQNERTNYEAALFMRVLLINYAYLWTLVQRSMESERICSLYDKFVRNKYDTGPGSVYNRSKVYRFLLCM